MSGASARSAAARSSAFTVECETCGTPVRVNELFGSKIRRD